MSGAIAACPGVQQPGQARPLGIAQRWGGVDRPADRIFKRGRGEVGAGLGDFGVTGFCGMAPRGAA